MTDMLVLTERVRNAILLGEGDFREFKSAYEGPPGAKRPRRWVDICRDVAEGLVGFANADGGDFLVGVEDDGTITGVPHTSEEIDKILNAPKTHVHSGDKLPLAFVNRLEIDDKVILFFSVLKGTTQIYQLPDGRCVRRVGARTVPERVQRIIFERDEAKSRSYCSDFLDDVRVTDLELSLLQSGADKRLGEITPEKYLQQLGLAEYSWGRLRLRRAAVLLFAQDIQRWHHGCQVRILKVQGNTLKSGHEYNVIFDKFVQGNVFYLLDNAWEALEPLLANKTGFGIDARFEQKYIYPEGACREALVNAIVHRDFMIHNGIEIFVFDDRMEVKSPGSLLSTLHLEQLRKPEGSHESRNALIARTVREIGGYTREIGEGMQRIFHLMEESDLIQPEVNSDLTSFTVTLFNKSVFNNQQRTWLNMFAEYNLSRYQQRIVVAGVNGRELSPSDIERAMNTQDLNTYNIEVTYLRNTGILELTKSQSTRSALAKRTGQSKKNIPCFKVKDPREKIKKIKDSNALKRIAVLGLPSGVTEEDLIDFFEPYGDVEEVEIPASEDIFQTKFAFVTFSNPATTLDLISGSQLLVMRGSPLTIKIYR